MIRTIGMACAALAAIFLCSGIDSNAAGQDPPPAAEPTSPYRVEQQYDPLQASRDAYYQAEEARRQAIDQQLGAVNYATWYGTWATPRVYAYSWPGVYAYPMRRSVRRAYRGVYVGPVAPIITPWPRVSVGVYGYPDYPPVPQPIGHEKIWTGPNSYYYRPIYAEPGPPTPAGVPTPAAVEPPAVNAAEPVPAPPVEAGPREF